MAKLSLMASKSKLMDIEITYNGKAYKFNLYDELQVTENAINKELKSHASSYAFLTQLRNHLDKRVKMLEIQKDKAYDKAYLLFKTKTSQTTGKPYTDDMAKSAAKSHKAVIETAEELVEARHHYLTLQDAVRAFEVRKDLIQSLSANLRNEK